jgi:hypothetical protein
MASLADYAANKVLDHITGKTSFTKPTAYLALFTVAPTNAGGGTECVYGGYARKITAGADWNAAASRSVANAGSLAFPQCTSGGETAVAAALFDAASAGNMLAWGVLTASRAIVVNDTPTFAAGVIVLSVAA